MIDSLAIDCDHGIFMKGFGLVGIIIVIAVIAALAGGGLYWKETQNQKSLLQSGNDAIKKAEALKAKIEGQNKSVVNESVADTSNWKTYTNNILVFKYPSDWIVTNYDYAHSVFIENTKKSITTIISEGPYPFGFTGPMEEKENPIKIIVDGKEYHTRKIIVANKNAYVNFELDTPQKHHILFGTGYPAGDDNHSSLEDYRVLKGTILKILSTLKFLK